MPSLPRILFIDDDPDVLTALARSLRRDQARWQMVFVDSVTAAFDALERETFDVVVSDFQMPGMDGARLFDQLRLKHRTTGRIMLSGDVEPSLEGMATMSAHELLTKPCSVVDLRACIERQLASDNSSSARFRVAARALSDAPRGA